MHSAPISRIAKWFKYCEICYIVIVELLAKHCTTLLHYSSRTLNARPSGEVVRSAADCDSCPRCGRVHFPVLS
ncbi:hypothetical protein RB195_009045 [Necator americanus]|uniref:Secreted protein n=1 Tax=Necator americanus TaxID=51031 RepID=A0ABR1CT88_NECAM